MNNEIIRGEEHRHRQQGDFINLPDTTRSNRKRKNYEDGNRHRQQGDIIICITNTMGDTQAA
jgi:hypothetical protein